MSNSFLFCLSIIFVACLSVSSLTTAAAADPPKPVWPIQFDVTFGLNSPAGDSLPSPIVNASSHFYYNWDLKASLITYESCLPGVFQDSQKYPCNITFNDIGTFLFVPDAGIDCCLWFPGVGSVPPQFLQGFNYSGFDQIVFDYTGVPIMTHYWVAQPLGGFQYWTDASNGHDIEFCDGGNVLWNFQPPFNVVNQNSSLFDIPPHCSILPCDFQEGHSIDPMMKLSMALASQ